MPTTRLAWSMTVRDPLRFLVSLAAIAFSTLALFLCLGFFNGMNDSQARIASVLAGDLLVLDRRTQSVTNFHDIGRSALYRMLGEPGIAEIIPVHQGALEIENPDTRMRKSIQYFAFPPGTDPFGLPGLEDHLPALRQPGTIVYDRDSREFYGRIDAGMDVLVAGVPVRVVGTVRYGPNFSRHGSIFMSDGTLTQRLGERRSDSISLGVVRLSPGADREAIRRRLQERLPEDFEVATRDELHTRELLFNVLTTPIGALLGVGLLLAVFVGVVVAYQVLYNEVTDHLPQFATLKAMGFSRTFLARVVLQQAFLLALLGFLPGAGLAWLAYQSLERASGTLMALNAARLLAALSLTLVMGVLAGRLALARALAADPADLY